MQRSANIERLWRMPAILFLLIEQCDIAADIPFVFEASDNGDTARLRLHRFCPISTSSNEAHWSANHQYLLLGSTFALIFALGLASTALFPHRLRTVLQRPTRLRIVNRLRGELAGRDGHADGGGTLTMKRSAYRRRGNNVILIVCTARYQWKMRYRMINTITGTPSSQPSR
ncbi:hypothetical protein OKW37_005062 [Paraburkholderia sp. MM5482-R2]